MRRLQIILFCIAFQLACGNDETPVADTGIVLDVGPDSVPGLDAATNTDMGASAQDTAPIADTQIDSGVADSGFPPCTNEPCPIEILSFPYRDSRSTTASVGRFDSYPACAPQDESGPEVAYVFRLDAPGTVVAGITDSDMVDVDVHLLSDLDPGACLGRGDRGVSAHLEPGIYYVVVDSFVSGAGVVGDGPYDLFVDFLADSGPCGMRSESIPRIGTTELLDMPATGRVVLEAHLLTSDEDASNAASGMTEFPSGWPTSYTDRIAHHYAVTQAASGYAMERGEPWAPCCEPTNEFGQGSSVLPPAEAEAWYINMRWRTAPARGERYIVVNPATGVAVVTAAGYENGPGDLSRIGGACEEVHDVLGTGHLSTLTFGAALDQTLPYGPIDCH